MPAFRPLALVLPLLLAPLAAQPQAYPARPINFVVQYAAGSGADQLARMVADAVTRANPAANFVIRNTPGALGVIGTTALVRSPADGYTVGICSASINSIATAINKSLPYDTHTDFTFIDTLASYTYVVTAAPELAFESLEALIKQAAAKPGALSYVYANATAQVLSAVLTKQLDLRALPVPYKSTAEGLADVSQNRVSFAITDVGSTMPMVRAGRVKPLAVMSARRSINLTDVPTLTELGKAPIQGVAWAGLCGPKNMPAEATAWLRTQLRKAKSEAETLEKYKLLGLDPLELGNQSMNDFVLAQSAFWTAAARDAGIKPE